MVIKNITKKTILADSYTECANDLDQARGLMFRKQQTLLFKFKKEKIVPLHMFFVFYPIDVVFVNKSRKVVEIVKDFQPFTFHKPKQRAQFVVELPAGTVDKSLTKIGDFLSFSG